MSGYFEEPTGRSSFDPLTGWTHGGVEAIGGGGSARIWYNGDARVIYEPWSDRVALQEWDGDEYRLVRSMRSADRSDRSKWLAARRLMHGPGYVPDARGEGSVDPEFDLTGGP